MLGIHDRSLRLCDGVSRREALRVGGLSALGLSLPQLIAAQEAHAVTERNAAAGAGLAFGKAKSVLLFWLSGGPPQHESWDPKPNAPAEIRGPFNSIATKTPGLSIGELMPKTAMHSDKLAVLRAVVSQDNSHSSSGYQMLTGVPHIPLSRENVVSKAPNLAPSLGAIVRQLRPDSGHLPAAITLPKHIANVGEIVWPGQGGGILGHQYDPWLLTCDPSVAGFEIPELALRTETPAARFQQRRSLLSQLDDVSRRMDEPDAVQRFDQHAQKALDLVTGRGAKNAFAIQQESDATRDRYGRTKFAQSVLLGRRLVESGVSLVQVNWQQLEGKENNGSWDTHIAHNASLKDFLMPIMDQCFSALLEDLEERGLLDETLVAWVGEFGHTPKFNQRAGRDHWGNCFSVALAGAGIKGGVVHGTSDAQAGFPIAGQVAPCDIAATIFHCLGHHPETFMHDQNGRPMPITRGKVIEEIL